MLLLSLIIGAGIGWLAYLVATAPEGWEDSDGFHLGPMPPFIADERDGTPIEHVFKLRHEAGHQVSDLFHTEANSEGAQRNHG